MRGAELEYERGIQGGTGKHQNHQVVVVDGPDVIERRSWPDRSVADGDAMLIALAFSQLSAPLGLFIFHS
ncbi:hypothetical protein DBY65_026220 [Pseudomonas sp. RIT412]|nr:hypothetical protein DBP26_026355 [Pseudomonas sp. RIT 409]RAU45684.1 hypothetical protein DBY65_026220 [Pseudomonas sp. RIT 412]